MKKVPQPHWATHLISILVPNPSYANRGKHKTYWYADQGEQIVVQLADDVEDNMFPPETRVIDGVGSMHWWRKRLTFVEKCEDMPFIGKLENMNQAVDDLKTLAGVLALPPADAIQWLTDHQHEVALVPRQLNKRMRDAFNVVHDAFHDGEEVEGSPDDEWQAIIGEWENEAQGDGYES